MRNFRNLNSFAVMSGNVMMWVKPVVHLLHALSTSGALGEGVSVVRWKAFHADVA
jgi:hypothetical protein